MYKRMPYTRKIDIEIINDWHDSVTALGGLNPVEFVLVDKENRQQLKATAQMMFFERRPVKLLVELTITEREVKPVETGERQ